MFLDEPTTGIDPRSRNQVWDIIRTLVAGGTTILLTTQYLDEADQLADRIAVIDHGRVIAEGNGATPAMSALEDSGLEVETFSYGQPSLDEVFLALTGKPPQAQNDAAGADTEKVT